MKENYIGFVRIAALILIVMFVRGNGNTMSSDINQCKGRYGCKGQTVVVYLDKPLCEKHWQELCKKQEKEWEQKGDCNANTKTET